MNLKSVCLRCVGSHEECGLLLEFNLHSPWIGMCFPTTCPSEVTFPTSLLVLIPCAVLNK